MRHGVRRDCACPSSDQDRLFICGNRRETNGTLYRIALEYNSASQSFSTHTPLPDDRGWLAATAIDDHRFLVVGGSPLSSSKSCCVYDTRTKEWSQDWPDLNIGRDRHTCVTANNKVYVIGGYSCEKGGSLDSIEELDLSLPTPRWRVLPQRLKTKRETCCAVVNPTDPNMVIVVGGWNSEHGILASCENVSLEGEQELEGHTRTIPSLTIKRYAFGLVVVENRFLVAIGGVNEGNYFASVEVLDLYEAPRDQQWRVLPSMRTPRASLAAFYSPRNHKIVVVGGCTEGGKLLDTAEELQVHGFGFEQRAPLPHEGLGQDQDGGMQDQDGGMCNRPPYQPLGKQPPLSELPTGCLDATHQGRIQQWLIASKEQMAAFVVQVDARERELVLERDGNRQILDAYVTQVNIKQDQAKGILDCIQDTDTRGEAEPNQKQTSIAAGMAADDGAAVPPHYQLGKAPVLKELQMDARSRRQMEMWIEEIEKQKKEFVSAIERREKEVLEEMNENKRVRDEYVAHGRMGMKKARAVVRGIGGTGIPHELLCPITHEVMVDPVITADGHTYERAAIERVFEEGNEGRSPVTGLVLSSRLLTPNVAIRSMCMDFAEDTSS